VQNLEGKKLSVVSITRQNLFDAAYIGCCDNCGRIIINIATVKDENGKTFEIGLDCKKTLIDKAIIDKLLLNSLTGKYDAKEYKQQSIEAEKFLKFCAYPDVEIEIDYKNNDVIIRDNKPNKQFPEINGNIIYMQNLGYLFKIGFKEFIENLYKNNKAVLA